MKNKVIHLMRLNDDLTFRYYHFVVEKELEWVYVTKENKTIYKSEIGKATYGRIYYINKRNEYEYKKMLIDNKIQEAHDNIKYYQDCIVLHEDSLIKLNVIKEKLWLNLI